MQQRRRAGERIRAVGDHEAVILPAPLPDCPRHLHPVGRCNVGRVALHEVEHFGVADGRKLRKLAQQAFPVEHRRKAVFGLPAGNRAARRDEQHLPRRSYMISHEFFFLSSKLTILLCAFCVRSQGKH